MKKPVFAILGAVAAMALSGCATVYRVSESVPPPHQQQERDIPAMRNPSVSIKTTPLDDKSGRLAEALRAAVEGALASKGFDIVSGRDVDFSISIDVSRREVARLSDWREYEGSAFVRIASTSPARLMASESFKAIGKRSLDESKAESTVGEALVSQMTRWLASTLPSQKIQIPPGPKAPECAEAILTISPADSSEDPIEVLHVQRRFMDYVALRPGIVSCRLVREEPSRREFSFFVEYEANSFPGGLLNTIVLDDPRFETNIELEIVH